MKTPEEIKAEGNRKADIRNRLLLTGDHEYVGTVSDEGLTPVRDILLGSKGPYDVWYHVDENNVPAYVGRFKCVTGFSDGVAEVKDGLGWFHIYPNGSAVYAERFSSYDTDARKKALQAALEESKELKHNGHAVS